MVSKYQEIDNNLKDRQKNTLDISNNPEQATFHIYTASTDVGVYRNGGRRGTKFGPKSIFSALSKYQVPFKTPPIYLFEYANDQLEESSFDDAKKNYSKSLTRKMQALPEKIIHIGGGHDHVLEILLALGNYHNSLNIINIDAHLDTRVDPIHHSGSPFREFDQQYSGNLSLIQIGIQDYANSFETKAKLTNGKMEIIPMDEVQNEFSSNFNTLMDEYVDELIPNAPIILSLDADALCPSIMEAVSAVNSQGVDLRFVKDAIHFTNNWNNEIEKCSVFGIYEYNPLYDNLSNKGSRALAELIRDFIID